MMKNIEVKADIGDTIFIVVGSENNIESIKKLKVTRLEINRDKCIKYICGSVKISDKKLYCDLNDYTRILFFNRYYVATEKQMRDKFEEFNLEYDDYIKIGEIEWEKQLKE